MWLVSAYISQLLLRFLFARWNVFKNFRKGGISLLDKLWFASIWLLGGSNPGLLSFQNCVPKLPVPALKDTLERYLRSVRPFMDDEEYYRVVTESEEFENGVGPKLQRYLVLKSFWSSNYVSDWWLKLVYLRSRNSLMINTNYYATDNIHAPPTNKQSARAANMIHACFLFRRLIDQRSLPPLRIAGTYPFCSHQYTNIYNSTRIPGVEEDKFVKFNESYHVTVYHKGRFFKLDCYLNGDLLKPADLQTKIKRILENNEAPVAGEEILPVLTATERQKWADIRTKYFSSGVNKQSLDIIDTSAFFVVLEDTADFWSHDESTLEDISAYTKKILHGKGYDRWFEKSFNLIVFENGKVGVNVEHSWGDAIVNLHLWEWTLVEDAEKLQYDVNGNCRGDASNTWSLPDRLQFEVPKDVIISMNEFVLKAEAETNDVDMCTYVHTRFGKEDIKKMKMSPDTFIQIAMQLAYYKHTGKVCLSYEPATTRLFKEGRTEAVRACSIESTLFVKAAEDSTIPEEEKRRLLINACDYHLSLVKSAMIGEGVDRHLFALYVMSQYLQTDVPFLKNWLNEKWLLMTSPVPVNQTMVSAGFGTVSGHGYGVGYMTCRENLITFHVTCRHSHPETNAKGFAHLIEDSMAQMRSYMLDNEGNLKK